MRLCSVFTALVVLAPVARVLAQSPANLVTVSFNFFNVPATFQVTFEDDLGDKFNSATFTQLNNPGVACNVGLGGGWVFSALEWQSVPINLYNTELGCGAKFFGYLQLCCCALMSYAAIKASVLSPPTRLLKALGSAIRWAIPDIDVANRTS
ncbi:hypothetical protein C8J55DRAFT_560124 [Lentinula edodes]|uniref:Uncharacterized protein n=1 Tax=Lentinula lateritia TaxID=40482 RepID=A0A9W9AFN3_9AGAR|nr:hypothetical protein C8J55DRAFT_560124 [Lentinula edodes]